MVNTDKHLSYKHYFKNASDIKPATSTGSIYTNNVSNIDLRFAIKSFKWKSGISIY